MAQRLSANFASLSSYFLQATGLSDVQAPGEIREPGADAGQTPPPSAHDEAVAATVDELLAGAGFKAEDVFDKYWAGHYNGDKVRKSLFGHLEGQALEAAVLQVLEHGLAQRKITSSEVELKAFKDFLAPLLEIAVAEGKREAVAQPQPTARAPLDAQAVVHALYTRRYGDNAVQALELFGGRTGDELWAALDQVTAALDDPLLNIAAEDRDRVLADIQSFRQRALVQENDALLASGSPVDEDRSTDSPLGGTVAGQVITALFDRQSGEDLGPVCLLFGAREGVDLLGAINEVDATLYQYALCGKIGAADRDRIGAELQRLRQAVTVEESDSALAELLRGPSSAKAQPITGSADSLEAEGPQPPPRQDALEEPHRREGVQVPRLRLAPVLAVRDLRAQVCRQALEQGGVARLQRLLRHLGPLQQWSLLSELVEDADLLNLHPRLADMEELAYRRYAAALGGNRPLERLRNWHRMVQGSGGGIDPLPVPTAFEPEAWIRLLRLMVFRRYPQRCRARDELTRALDAYKQLLDVQTPRNHAQVPWLEAVEAAARGAETGHALLEALLRRVGNDSNAALALLEALAQPQVFDYRQMDLVYRAGAILMARHDHSLPCIGMSYLKKRTPQKLHVLCPRKPGENAPLEAWRRYEELVSLWVEHAPLVDKDCDRIRTWLSRPPTTKPDPKGPGTLALTTGEQCDRLLCQMELPPKRVELGLLKVAQSCKDPDDREMHLLARRLLSELVHSERNDAGRNQPMKWHEILSRLLSGLVLNGAREGVAHGVALFAVRAISLNIGAYALPLMGLGSFALSLWSWTHLNSMKSPDYLLNPSPVVDALIEVVPSLTMPALIGLVLCTGILPMTNAINVPFALAESLFLMNLMRLLRQLMQSGTQPLARNFRLTDRHGVGLPAQVAFITNCARDALYMGGSVGFLIYLASYLNELMEGWAPAASIPAALLRVAVGVVPSFLNEASDGLNPDISVLGVRLVFWLRGVLGWGDDDYMLQPAAPLAWDAVPMHLADHATGRTIVGLQDPFHAASEVARHLGQPEWAAFFKWTAVLSNGFLGSMRGRFLSYLRTTDPRSSAAGGQVKNPDGLLVAMLYVGQAGLAGARQVQRRLMPPAQTLPSLGLQLPPLDLTVVRERARTLIQSQRGPTSARDAQAPPDDLKANLPEEGSLEEEGSTTFVELSGGTPKLHRGPGGFPPDDFSEQ